MSIIEIQTRSRELKELNLPKEELENEIKYGYARCSTREDKQDINRQICESKAAGAEKAVFECFCHS